MSEFSEAIKAEIKKSGQTLLYLSDASGLSLDHISKMRQGKRLPQDTEKVRKLIMALQCSEDVSKTLFSLYKIERMGNEEWNCMQEIKKMLEYRTGFLDIAQLDIQVEEGDWEALQDIHVLHSRTEVISFLQRILPQSGHILRMFTEELPEAVVEILAQFLSRRDICCEHVFSLKKVREQGGSLYNLQYINQIMPLIRSDSEYIAYYDYEEKCNDLLPNWFIGDKWAVGLHRNMESGLIVWKEEKLSYLKEIFERKKKNKRQLLRYFANVSQWADWITENRKRYLTEQDSLNFRPQEMKNYYMEYDPCLMRMLSEDMLKNHLLLEDTGKKMVLENWRQRCNQLEKEKAVHIFTREGLEYTAMTGRLAEIPSSIYTPLTNKERLEVMENYLEWMKLQDGEVYMLDEGQVSLPRGIFVYSTVSMVDNEITFCIGADGVAYCSIYEQGVAEKLNHFCRMIEEGEMVCSKETCLKIIKQQIEYLQEELKKELKK
ncbi:helix-turn-helix transcriptional regulator [Ventrimonas sp. CLA-AP-H27]|uniref:Helix-turn-helix transcriptional regulator n=1 Tax=Ventrimonas faecis TaxID=3133170 RepID=A0ABV1HHK4_9FIRM